MSSTFGGGVTVPLMPCYSIEALYLDHPPPGMVQSANVVILPIGLRGGPPGGGLKSETTKIDII